MLSGSVVLKVPERKILLAKMAVLPICKMSNCVLWKINKSWTGKIHVYPQTKVQGAKKERAQTRAIWKRGLGKGWLVGAL